MTTVEHMLDFSMSLLDFLPRFKIENGYRSTAHDVIRKKP